MKSHISIMTQQHFLSLPCCFYLGKWKSNDKSSSLSQKRAGFGTRVFASNKSQPEKSTHLPVVATSTFSKPSQSEDDTGELLELYQLLSSREVLKLGQTESFRPTVSKAVPSHQDLATMLAELAGSNNWRPSPSVLLTSSSAWTTPVSSAVAGERGKTKDIKIFVSVIGTARCRGLWPRVRTLLHSAST